MQYQDTNTWAGRRIHRGMLQQGVERILGKLYEMKGPVEVDIHTLVTWIRDTGGYIIEPRNLAQILIKAGIQRTGMASNNLRKWQLKEIKPQEMPEVSVEDLKEAPVRLKEGQGFLLVKLRGGNFGKVIMQSDDGEMYCINFSRDTNVPLEKNTEWVSVHDIKVIGWVAI